MFVLGLTGGIAMGKSTVAGFLRALGVPVFDADAAVHRLLNPEGPAVAAVAAAFPDCADAQGVDRAALGRRVFADAAALTRLEAILHPLVQAEERPWLARAARRGDPLVVLDIPLLFETGGEDRVDAVAVVSAPAFIQAQRVLARPGMTRERLAAVRRRQLPDGDKRRRADFVIPTGLNRRQSVARVEQVVRALRARPGRAWPSRWPPLSPNG
jgi:dephospho-CoA kinase